MHERRARISAMAHIEYYNRSLAIFYPKDP